MALFVQYKIADKNMGYRKHLKYLELGILKRKMLVFSSILSHS